MALGYIPGTFFDALLFSIFSPAQLLSLLLDVRYVSPVSGLSGGA